MECLSIARGLPLEKKSSNCYFLYHSIISVSLISHTEAHIARTVSYIALVFAVTHK